MHTPEAVNGSVRPTKAAVNHQLSPSSLAKIDTKSYQPRMDDSTQIPLSHIGSLDASHTMLMEQSILPYIVSRSLQITIHMKELLKRAGHSSPKQEVNITVSVKAERLVTHPNSKWCWKAVGSQYPTVPLFTPTTSQLDVRTASDTMTIMIPSGNSEDIRHDMVVPFIFNAMCKENAINIFRLVIESSNSGVVYQRERPMITLNLSETQVPEHGVQYCNDVTLEICRDVDPLWSWYWQDSKRALSQKTRILSVMDTIPLEENKSNEPQLVLTTPQPVLSWEKPADMDFDQIAQQLSILPDPNEKNVSPPIIETTSPITPIPFNINGHNHHYSNGVMKEYLRGSPKLKSPRTTFGSAGIKSKVPNINCKDLTMQSLYEMIGSLSPTPTTPLSATGSNFEWPSVNVSEKKNSRRARKPTPLTMNIDKIDKKNTMSPATQRQHTPFLVSMMAADSQKDAMMADAEK